MMREDKVCLASFSFSLLGDGTSILFIWKRRTIKTTTNLVVLALILIESTSKYIEYLYILLLVIFFIFIFIMF